ncbi:MAG: MBG domain-containing protein [Cytophagaceae bacterium]
MVRRLIFSFSIIFSLLLSFHTNAQFRAVGYYPTWVNYPAGINSVDLTKLTHINIAFANPNAAGTLIPADGTNADVTTIVNACHAKNVKVFISIGGAGAPGATYQNLLSSAANINSFVTKLVSYTTTYNLDGIDVDIEGDVLDGTTVTAAQYQTFVTSLATALHAQNKLMSAALATWFGSYVTKTAAAQFDWIGIMSYDNAMPCCDPAGPTAPYSQVTSDFAYWNGTKAVPGSKLNIGLPFYGYGWGTYGNGGNEISYCTIVSTYAGAENNDVVGSGSNAIYYNGIPTIKQKTNYAIANAGGIMIWQITEDCSSTSPKSLLAAIDATIHPPAINPTITFNNVSKTYGAASFTVAATSNSPGAITYSITAGNSFASITSGGTVTITGAGTVTIQASQVAATGYNAMTKTATLTIAKAPLTATANNQSKVYNTANPALTISYSGFVYSETSSVLTTAPSISTTAVTGSNVGTYPITLSGGAAANYTITLTNGTLTVNPAAPTLSYTGLTSGTAGGTINLTSSSNSAGAVNYSVANGTGTATVTGTTLNLSTAGTVTLTLNLAASGNYSAGTVTQTITINAANQNPTITFNNVSKTYGAAGFTVAATSNSPGAITYSITAGNSFASITSGGTVTITGAGTVTIQASQAAATGYNAGTKTATLTIAKAALTATANNQSKIYNTANPPLTIAYSGFVYSETSSALTTAPSISTTALTASNAGTYPITLSGGAAANYTIALANGTLTVNPATPTLSYTGLTSGTAAGTINLTSSSNSTGAITYSVVNGTGSGSVSGTTLNLSTAGSVTLTVSLAASTNYTAQSITQTITINPPANQNPSIVFGNISKNYGDPSFTVSASSNSSGTFTYSIISGASFATITSGGQVTVTGAGAVTIQASQAAGPGYNAGTANATLTINKASGANTSMNSPNSGNPGTVISLSPVSNSTGPVTFSIVPGGTGSGTLAGSQLTLDNPGIITLQVIIGGDANYNNDTILQQITINTVTALHAQQSGLELSVFPNPVTDHATLQLNLSGDCHGSLVLCDMNGKVISVIAEGYIARQESFLIQLSQYPSGLYLLRLDTEKGSYYHKIAR